MTFSVEAVRAQFPALHQPVGDRVLPIYFDNPAGTQVPQQVIEAVSHYFTHLNGNAGGVFATSQATDEMVHRTREKLAAFLNAPSADDIVLGPNMTSLSFALSRAVGKTLRPGDEIVLTRMDHDANVEPWRRIAEDYGLVVRWADIRIPDCVLDLDSLEAALTDKTRIVATVHASNASGSINPVAQIAEMAHAAGALYVVDAVQSAPHLPINVQALKCDFLLCSAYKFFGPHIGVMWGRHDLLASLPVYKVRPAKDAPPYRWETGTPSFETIAGVGAALDYLRWIGREFGAAHKDQFPGRSEEGMELNAGMAALRVYERELLEHLMSVVLRLPGVETAGITDLQRFDQRVPTVIFSLPNHTPRAVAEHLAAHHIYVWDGNYYALEIMKRLGREKHGMVRVGLAHYNTHGEIERFESVLKRL